MGDLINPFYQIAVLSSELCDELGGKSPVGLLIRVNTTADWVQHEQIFFLIPKDNQTNNEKACQLHTKSYYLAFFVMLSMTFNVQMSSNM